jgi:hypothetical protein
VNVVPAAIVMALLRETVVGGVGKMLVAVRRCIVAFKLGRFNNSVSKRRRTAGADVRIGGNHNRYGQEHDSGKLVSEHFFQICQG